MQILSIEDVAAKTRLSPSTIYERIAAGGFPKALPLGKRRRGWLEDEIDRWIAERAAERDAVKVPVNEGRQRFWDDVRAGRRPHPRVVGRLRKAAALAET